MILSDASVPGEGEHKIMEHIRQQRCLPGYEPNTRHVIHGLDADLIMLALATHEPHFCILREVVLDRKAKMKQEEQIAMGHLPGPPKMQFLQVWVLREYLQVEFSMGLDWSRIPGGFDLEKVIDDFVFMCFFVGNDFLPHIPALEIRDGAIDMLIYAYKALLPKLGGYLSDAGRVHLPRTELLLREVAAYEDEIFERRRRREEGRERAIKAKQAAESGVIDQKAFGGLYPPRDPQQKQVSVLQQAHTHTRTGTQPLSRHHSPPTHPPPPPPYPPLHTVCVCAQYYAAMKQFAESGGPGMSETLILPTATMSGFHKASVHLYVTLLGLAESTGPNKEIVVRYRKADQGKKQGSSGGGGGMGMVQPGLLGEEEEGGGGAAGYDSQGEEIGGRR